MPVPLHRLGQSQAMHLKAAHFQQGHPGKFAHLRGVALDASLHGLARGTVFVPCGAAGQHQRRGHALQVPLERTAVVSSKSLMSKTRRPSGAA